jgi:hypothetical protein
MSPAKGAAHARRYGGSSSEEPAVKRPFLPAALVVLATLALGVGAAELALRVAGFSAPIWYEPHGALGWAMRPGAEGWFTREGRAYARVNAAGFRDREHALDKPPGVYRIAVLGDSFVEALQVEREATFWSRMGGALQACPRLQGRNLEVLAFGVSGYGTAQQALLLESTASRYQPDFVLLAFTPNDVRNNSVTLEPENERPFFRIDGQALALDASFAKRPRFVSRQSWLHETYRASSDWSRVVQLVQAARHGLRKRQQAAGAAEDVPGVEPNTSIALFGPPRVPAWQEAWTVTERLIARMHRQAVANDRRFAVMVVTHSAQVHPDAETRKRLRQALDVPDLFYVERRLAALGERDGFPVIPLAPELQKRADAAKVYFHGFDNYRVGWGHWNEQGHAAAAAIVAARLCPLL